MTNLSRPVKKAVFPVAGLGTRFLPATKAVPKEMLTVVDRPVIQYAVDEARAAGITHFVFVTGRNKHVIEDHFDLVPELLDTLRSRSKQDALDALDADQPEAGETSFTRQQAPLGLGHAVWCARDIVGDEPFALFLPDMVMLGEPPCMKGMVEAYERTGGNIIAVEECDPAKTASYGIVDPKDGVGDTFAIKAMVEKPAPADAPTNLMINGRYILQPEIFDLLSTQERGAGGEIQLTDSMDRLIEKQPFHAYTFRGKTFDCGSKDGFIAANVAFALQRDDIAPTVRPAIEELIAAG